MSKCVRCEYRETSAGDDLCVSCVRELDERYERRRQDRERQMEDEQ